MENVLEGVKVICIETFLITPRKDGKTIPLPAVIGKDGDVFIAWCPIVNVATQGDTIEEVIENMGEMLLDYYTDPDTVKPTIKIKKELSVRVGVKLERLVTPKTIGGAHRAEVTPFTSQKSR